MYNDDSSKSETKDIIDTDASHTHAISSYGDGRGFNIDTRNTDADTLSANNITDELLNVPFAPDFNMPIYADSNTNAHDDVFDGDDNEAGEDTDDESDDDIVALPPRASTNTRHED